MKRSILLTIGLLCLLFGKIMGQTEHKTKADLAWLAILDNTDLGRVTSDVGSIEWFKAYDAHYKKMWSLGMEFWKKFPTDPRSTSWFTIGRGEPLFYKDIDAGLKARNENQGNYHAELDWKKLEAYDKDRNQLRNVILNDPKVSKEEKNRLRVQELGLVYERGLNKAYRKDKDFYLFQLQNAFETAISGLEKYQEVSLLNADFRFIPQVFTKSMVYGFGADDYLNFLNRYKHASNPQVRSWISKQLAIFRLKEKPLELKHQTINGDDLDLAKLRGKVVLVDFWATSCSTCIARMPFIKQIYDKYKDQGFEVISAAYNPEIDKEKVLSIHEKIGADWPVIIVGGDAKSGYINPNSLGQKIWNTYGFTTVPQLLLLDKDGKLIMHNDLLLQGDFEPLVKKLVNE